MESKRNEILKLLENAKSRNAKEPEVARALGFDALDIAKSFGFNNLMGESLLTILLADRLLSLYEEALDCAEEARQIFEAENNQDGLMRLYNIVGILYYYNGLYDLAMEHFKLAYQKALSIDNKKIVMASLNNIGEVKKRAGDIEAARETYNKGLELAKDNKLTRHYGTIIQNIGALHLQENQLDQAEACFLDAYSSLREDPETINLSELFLNFGRLYLKRQDPERAREYYNSALTKLEGIRNNFYQLDVLIELYKLELPDKPKVAIEYLTKARSLAIESKSELKLSDIELLLNEFYESKRNYERALFHFKHYHNLIQKLDANNLILKLKILNMQGVEQSGITTQKNVEDNRLTSILDNEIENEREKIKMLEKQNEALAHQAMHDKLTQLPNRRKIDIELSDLSETIRTGRRPTSVGLFMIDIDHFKRVNDAMGHLFGDKCLEQIATMLERVAKKYNGFVGRYGGEEFIFVKPGLVLDQAREISTELNQAVRNMNIRYHIDEDPYTVTISVGGLFCEPLRSFSKNELIDLADQALYTAKAQGRDCVILNIYNQPASISVKSM